VPVLDRLMAHLADLAHEDAGGDGGAHAKRSSGERWG
jgi:hypothetical protein